MKEDKRFYTFVFAPTAKSTLRKINIPHNVLYAILGFAFVGLLTVAYGAYRLAEHAVVVARLNLMQQKVRDLQAENQEVKNQKSMVVSRLAALDTTQRQLAATSGINRQNDISKNVIGQGGPGGDASMTDIERMTAALESELRQIKDVFDKNQVQLSSTPSGWPVRGYITDGFGYRNNPFGGGGTENHAGLDIATNHGTAIQSTADGIVIFAGVFGGYGNVVVIDHGYGVTTRYGHMSRIDVQVGQQVTRGKQIGAVGSTGRSTAPHCHYEVRLHDRPVNPLNYLSVGRL
ncbi:MAG TPA: peptidoglycan DD-metalloendopeptidase family protein [Blastocatellia bacterium]|nr:peptidoglycan DD-metalloendopeptidase family protein [Blastocatellia bacterium]HMX26087.1 peptidoglycan DD-metalloendopeptidase family protein [Blastocatellia bacterium]HMY73528.1 peptidoglycan DD-metalloendopeptidase family protein [Blastocatellia bacterium]HMZ17623.1 peptidoglycan DD-metalloendopeptidase family protein [Blastocatellia bacterium]HNG29778.1 peptidoglycan DD-metalloendopeptidase family protein [Blastocatellia bacterium]